MVNLAPLMRPKIANAAYSVEFGQLAWYAGARFTDSVHDGAVCVGACSDYVSENLRDCWRSHSSHFVTDAWEMLDYRVTIQLKPFS